MNHSITSSLNQSPVLYIVNAKGISLPAQIGHATKNASNHRNQTRDPSHARRRLYPLSHRPYTCSLQSGRTRKGPCKNMKLSLSIDTNIHYNYRDDLNNCQAADLFYGLVTPGTYLRPDAYIFECLNLLRYCRI